MSARGACEKRGARRRARGERRARATTRRAAVLSHFLRKSIVSFEVENEFISMKRTLTPSFLRIESTCFAVRSRNVSWPLTTSRLLAKSRPMPVPSPPLSLSTTVSESSALSTSSGSDASGGTSVAGAMLASGIMPVSPFTCVAPTRFASGPPREVCQRTGQARARARARGAARSGARATHERDVARLKGEDRRLRQALRLHLGLRARARRRARASRSQARAARARFPDTDLEGRELLLGRRHFYRVQIPLPPLEHTVIRADFETAAIDVAGFQTPREAGPSLACTICPSRA